jgi:hypothetical protein
VFTLSTSHCICPNLHLTGSNWRGQLCSMGSRTHQVLKEIETQSMRWSKEDLTLTHLHVLLVCGGERRTKRFPSDRFSLPHPLDTSSPQAPSFNEALRQRGHLPGVPSQGPKSSFLQVSTGQRPRQTPQLTLLKHEFRDRNPTAQLSKHTTFGSDCRLKPRQGSQSSVQR